MMGHTAPCAAAVLAVSAGHEPSICFQVMRSTWKWGKTQTEHDGFESDAVGTGVELGEKVMRGVGKF